MIPYMRERERERERERDCVVWVWREMALAEMKNIIISVGQVTGERGKTILNTKLYFSIVIWIWDNVIGLELNENF